MDGNHVFTNVFGTLGAVCWSVQLIPQIILNYRRHSAAGLSPTFMLCWACAGIPLGVYNIVSNFNIALRIQPQILTSLSLITYGQCYYYERKWRVWKVLAAVLPLACVMGGIECGLVFAIRFAVKHETNWPLTLMAAFAAALLALGVIEQYVAIWRNRSVEGISFLFCGIDALGDVTSTVSVAFEPTVNILGFVMYGVEFVLWCGVFACGFWFKLLPWMKRTLRQRKRERVAEATSSGTRDATSEVVSLHGMQSSTSVFRIASEDTELRERQTTSANDC